MIFYKSPDWAGRALVPSLKISPDRGFANDEPYLLRAFRSKLPFEDVALNTMKLVLLPGGPQSDNFKFSLHRTKRWGRLKLYPWRVAWLRVPDELASQLGPLDTAQLDPLQSQEVYGLSTLRTIKQDHRNLAANWDVLHCLEDLFGGDLEIIPPNVNR